MELEERCATALERLAEHGKTLTQEQINKVLHVTKTQFPEIAPATLDNLGLLLISRKPEFLQMIFDNKISQAGAANQ